MRKSKANALLTLLAASILPATSHAIVVHIDDPHQYILRPSSGTATATFTGSIDITAGYELSTASATSLWNASGDVVAGIFPDIQFGVGGILFKVTVDSTDSGLYAYNFSLANPAQVSFAECPFAGGLCNNAVLTYSLNVVDRLPVNVPEPSTLALMGMGLMAVWGFSRRRRN